MPRLVCPPQQIKRCIRHWELTKGPLKALLHPSPIQAPLLQKKLQKLWTVIFSKTWNGLTKSPHPHIQYVMVSGRYKSISLKRDFCFRASGPQWACVVHLVSVCPVITAFRHSSWHHKGLFSSCPHVPSILVPLPQPKLNCYFTLRSWPAVCVLKQTIEEKRERERKDICLHIMQESKRHILKWMIKDAQMPQVIWLEWLKSLWETYVVWNVILIVAILYFF